MQSKFHPQSYGAKHTFCDSLLHQSPKQSTYLSLSETLLSLGDFPRSDHDERTSTSIRTLCSRLFKSSSSNSGLSTYELICPILMSSKKTYFHSHTHIVFHTNKIYVNICYLYLTLRFPPTMNKIWHK